jgi:hypothetical protein
MAWKLPLITFVCFVFSNIASTLMVQAEARNRAVIGGIFEAIYALFWIYAAKYALNTSVPEIIALVLGNFFGAVLGVKFGARFVTDHDDVETKSRLAEAEAALAITYQALAELDAEVEMHHELDEERHQGHEH